MAEDFYRVIGGERHEGAIVVSQLDEPVDYSPLLSGRIANIVPVDSVDKVTAAVNAYTQTIGIYPESLKRRLRDTLPLFGAQRLTSLGYACNVAIAMPQDAIEPIRRMCKWIVDEECDPQVVIPLWQLHRHDRTSDRAGRRRRNQPVRQGMCDHGRVLRAGPRVGPGTGRRGRARRPGRPQPRCPGVETAQWIATEVPGAQTSTVELDLTALARVRAAASAIGDIAPAIDVLMNNAGVMFTPFGRTRDGFEIQIGTNHFGHFELTRLLVPQLAAAGQGPDRRPLLRRPRHG